MRDSIILTAVAVATAAEPCTYSTVFTSPPCSHHPFEWFLGELQNKIIIKKKTLKCLNGCLFFCMYTIMCNHLAQYMHKCTPCRSSLLRTCSLRKYHIYSLSADAHLVSSPSPAAHSHFLPHTSDQRGFSGFTFVIYLY